MQTCTKKSQNIQEKKYKICIVKFLFKFSFIKIFIKKGEIQIVQAVQHFFIIIH